MDRPVSTPSASTSRLTLADAGPCPVTKPQLGPADVSPDSFFGWGASYGNGKLWVGGLWPNGIILGARFLTTDGAVDMNFGWWRAVPGSLTITGRRLDAPAPPASGDVPDGYGQQGFQASGVIFPTQGCWQITGTVGTTSLTFVTFVVLQSDLPSPSASP